MTPSLVLVASGTMLALLAANGAARLTPRRLATSTTPSSASVVHRRSRAATAATSTIRVAGVAALVTIALVVLDPLVGAMSATAAVAVRSARRINAERRRRRSIDSALPDAIDLLVLTIHAGATPAQAIVDIGPHLGDALRPAFDTVALRLQRGQRLADAVGALPEMLGHRAAALADGVASAERYGLPLAPVLRSLSDEARADRRRSAEAHARSLSVKLSFPLVTCTLPSFVLLAIVPAVMGALRSLPTSPVRP